MKETTHFTGEPTSKPETLDPTTINKDQDCAKVNPNPEPRKLDDLDVHWWWGFWDWLMVEGRKDTIVAPSLPDWLGHMKDIYTIHHSSNQTIIEDENNE